ALGEGGEDVGLTEAGDELPGPAGRPVGGAEGAVARGGRAAVGLAGGGEVEAYVLAAEGRGAGQGGVVEVIAEEAAAGEAAAYGQECAVFQRLKLRPHLARPGSPGTFGEELHP